MREMLKLQYNGVKIYKKGFPMVVLSVPTQRKRVQGEKSGEWTQSLGRSLPEIHKCPRPGYLQFITHQASQASIFSSLSESTGWIARVRGRVFIKINWATQLFAIFSKCCSVCSSSFSHIQHIHNVLGHICTLFIYSLTSLNSRKGGDLSLVQACGRGFRKGGSKRWAPSSRVFSACQSQPAPSVHFASLLLPN